jgi:hypothetical protein
MSSDESILFANNLIYKSPLPTSVTVNRCLKRQYFQNTAYAPQQTMINIFNTGTSFVDCVNSSLVLKLKFNFSGGTAYASFGRGSGMNLLRNVRVYGRTGVCYSNTQRYNLYRKVTDRYQESDNWFNSVGRVMGYDQTSNEISNVIPGTSDTLTIVIPLKKLNGLFDSEGGQFMPSAMASGLRLEIDLSSVGEALVLDATSTGTLDSYAIEQCYIETMNVQLQDSAQASLNTMAAQESLEYIYKDVFTSLNTAPSLTSAVNIDINKSVSFADMVMTGVQDSQSLNNLNEDSFDLDYRAAEWWYSLGSNYYPSSVKVDDDRVAYKDALLAFNKLKTSDKESSVTLQNFNTTNGVYAVSLENDTSLALSQQPVNNSMSLRFEARFDTPPPDEITTTVFLTYLVSSRTTLTSSRIDL